MELSASDEGKLFVGGIAWDTNEDALRDYFNNFGEVKQAVIMRDKNTGHPRGFGFVVFSDPAILEAVLRDKHAIHGRTVEVKRALSREDQQSFRSRDSVSNFSRNFSGSGNHRTKKIFVGGLPSTLTDGEFAQYFQNYGDITDVVIMFDQNTGRPRGFGFITFDTEDAVDRVLHKTFHELNNKLVEVKRALPKEANSCSGNRGRNFNAYSPSGINANTFDSRMEISRVWLPQPGPVGYPSYSVYGAPSYGYGLANNSAFYGGFGGYGFGGYGSATAGYSAAAVTHANRTAGSTGFVNSYAGLGKSQWSNQTHGHGSLGFGLNAGYGATVPWNIQDSTASIGQSPISASKSGNQSYRYGSYHGSEGSYTDSSRNRTVGRRSSSISSNNGGHNANETGHHRLGGGHMGKSYGSSNASSQHPSAA